MNKDTIQGAAKDAKGSIKETVGRVTGNEKLQAEGMVDQVAGKVQHAYGEAKDTVRKALKD